MNPILLFTSFALFAAYAFSQSVTIPAAGANGCADGYFPGTDTVLFTVPYPYTQVLSIIGNYTNLTWSGSPDNSVTTNGTLNDWVPGVARFYEVAGAHAIETITVYDKPAIGGPYVEVHTLAPLSIAAYNVSFYSDFDGQVWTSVCNGMGTASNFTVHFCANNVTLAAAVLHSAHLTDAQTVGKFLGGMNYSSCAALGSTSTTTGATVMFTGAANGRSSVGLGAGLGGAMAGLLLNLL